MRSRSGCGRTHPGERAGAQTRTVCGLNARDVARISIPDAASVYGAPPAAPDQQYLTVALFDADSGKRIPEASVRARVSTPTNSGRERALKRSVVGDATSYGDYFAMPGSGPFQVTVRVQRLGKPDLIEARFDYAP